MSSPLQLKYLFSARLSDGSVFKQNSEDLSTSNPLRTSFYDLCQLGLENIQQFWIEGDGRRLLIDLETGHFELDGARFFAGDPRDRVKHKRVEFRLVYFRRHTHTLEPATHKMEYHVGWQAAVDGRNIQQTIILE